MVLSMGTPNEITITCAHGVNARLLELESRELEIGLKRRATGERVELSPEDALAKVSETSGRRV